MNKAFVREPDDTGVLHCPACGSLGVAVHRETWQLHVTEEAAGGLAETAFFCPYTKCDVVYFDMFERRATTDALRHGVYPKDPTAPICGCFGLTCEDIQADIREGVVTRVRELLAKAKSPEARCRTMAADGQSCVPEVQRYYMKHRGGG
jgi:CopZ-like zinc binding protein